MRTTRLLYFYHLEVACFPFEYQYLKCPINLYGVLSVRATWVIYRVKTMKPRLGKALTILSLDGERIAEEMLSRGIGVKREPLYLLELDNDFFDFE